MRNVTRVAFLGCNETVSILRHFKLDDSLSLRGMLKDITVGLVYIQTICYLLWDALISLWTWLCVSQAGLLRDWYLAL